MTARVVLPRAVRRSAGTINQEHVIATSRLQFQVGRGAPIDCRGPSVDPFVAEWFLDQLEVHRFRSRGRGRWTVPYQLLDDPD